MTLNSFLESLNAAPSTASLVFSTDQGDVGTGYHVTEFKHAKITGIDCGARVSEWVEASMQLLDDKQGSHMKVGKFAGILQKSVVQVAGLGEASTRIEFAPRNDGMRTYEMDVPEIRGDTVLVRMHEIRAVCKPAIESGGTCEPSQGCGPSLTSRGCCS